MNSLLNNKLPGYTQISNNKGPASLVAKVDKTRHQNNVLKPLLAVLVLVLLAASVENGKALRNVREVLFTDIITRPRVTAAVACRWTSHPRAQRGRKRRLLMMRSLQLLVQIVQLRLVLALVPARAAARAAARGAARAARARTRA